MPKHYRKVTEAVVCGAVFLGLMFTAWEVASLPVFFICFLVATYEGWTLINGRPNDTISEIIWKLAKRPMVPFLFGVASGAAVARGIFGDSDRAVLCGAVFFVLGHLFFQKYEEEK